MRIANTWKNNDRITLSFPMQVKTRTWIRTKAVSVWIMVHDISLKIKENYVRYDSKVTLGMIRNGKENADPTK